jgi:hypothetical protein
MRTGFLLLLMSALLPFANGQHYDTTKVLAGIWDVGFAESTDSLLTASCAAKVQSFVGANEYLNNGQFVISGIKTPDSDSMCYKGEWSLHSGVLKTCIYFTTDPFCTKQAIYFIDANTFYARTQLLPNYWIFRVWRRRVNPPSSQTAALN